MHIAREREQLLGWQHLHGLFSHCLRRLFQVELAGDGDDEDVVREALAHGDEGLEHPLARHSHERRRFHARRSVLGGELFALRKIGAGGIARARPVQSAHRICLFGAVVVCHIAAGLRRRNVPPFGGGTGCQLTEKSRSP